MNTILFDLDGTVLPLDTEHFLDIYFEEMEKAFEEFDDKEHLVNNVWAATGEMVKSTDERTNEQVFMESFDKLTKGRLEDYTEVFDKFYDEGYLNTKVAIKDKDNTWIKKSINLLREKGYTIVIATNPIFPKKAIYHRVKWSGFEPEEFDYIACYENNHYCKPQIKYYEEILKDTNKNPEDCMMVGNDVQEDMIAGKLGIKTFLINNHVINRTGEEVVSDYEGSYEDFYEFVRELPVVKEHIIK